MIPEIAVERHGAVQTIRLQRPDKKNAITRAMYRAMAAALADGGADQAVRAHVFFGVPGAFSAGNDLGDFLGIAAGSEATREVWEFLEALAGAEKPILSGVDGIAVGIGTTLNLHCDGTWATPRTMFRTPFVDLGLVPEAGSSLLAPAVMGHQRAFALLAAGDPFSAPEALAAGLIRGIVEEADLESTVLEAAAKLAAKPPEALRIARALIRPPRELVLARIREEGLHFEERLRSDEAREALAAFAGRKKG